MTCVSDIVAPVTVAFVCAMPLELSALARAIGMSRVRGPVGEVHRARLDGREVVAVATGMGTAMARTATIRLFETASVHRVLVVGIAGGVDTATPIGTVVDPEVVIDAASGTEHLPHRIDRPDRVAGEAPRGALWTTDTMTLPDELESLRARGVVALDMETAAIGAVCAERGVPWSVFRAISDDPTDEVDDELFAMANQDGTPNPRNVVRYLLRHPQRVPRLARMGRNSGAAAGRAASAAVAAYRELAATDG